MIPLAKRRPTKYPWDSLRKPGDSFTVKVRGTTVGERDAHRERIENSANSQAYRLFGKGGYRIEKRDKAVTIWRVL